VIDPAGRRVPGDLSVARRPCAREAQDLVASGRQKRRELGTDQPDAPVIATRSGGRPT
jgi:hypothetical protein